MLKINFISFVTLIVLLLPACGNSKQPTTTQTVTVPVENTVISEEEQKEEVPLPIKGRLDLYLDSIGFINIAEADNSLVISLAYATPDNFLGEVLYDGLTQAYLHPFAAEKLLKAQHLLKQKQPDYNLIVYDATRPMSVQQKMWDSVKGTSKNIYVSNPARGGGMHNYGLAVDVSIVDENGNPLPMGTEFDHFGYEAHINNEAELVKKGIITQQERENRLLLREVMRGAGFRTLNSEWWHFNATTRDEAKRNYQVIN